jgi:perosamine synthetase
LKLVRHLSNTAKVGADYHHDRVGFNYRMTNIAAAVSCAQVERLAEFVAIKHNIQRKYNEAIKNLPGVGLLPQPEWADGACWLSEVTMPNVESAESLRGQLKENDIESKPFWKSIHPPADVFKFTCNGATG